MIAGVEIDAILARLPNPNGSQEQRSTTETHLPSDPEMRSVSAISPATASESKTQGTVRRAAEGDVPSSVLLRFATVRRLSADEMSAEAARAFVDSLDADLSALGEALSLELRSAGTRDPASDGTLAVQDADAGGVIIVAELGRSTDSGFGRLLRRMGATASRTGIWLTADPRAEHVATVSWLNRSVEGRFFMVALRAVQIQGTSAALIFDPVVRPPRADDPVPKLSESPAAAPTEGGRRAEEASPGIVEHVAAAETDPPPDQRGESHLLQLYGEGLT